MSNENSLIMISEIEDEEVDTFYGKLEEFMELEIDSDIAEIEFLEKEKEKIGNPESLVEVISGEIEKQFYNQFGLEITDQSLVREYDKTHADPEKYNDKIGDDIMKDDRYKNARRNMAEAQKAGTLVDAYTGKELKFGVDQFDVDHVEPRKLTTEKFFVRGSDEDPNMLAIRRAQAGISEPADLTNMPENLVPTHRSINRSKKDKSNTEYVQGMPERETALREQNARAKQKIDASDKSEADKAWEKAESDKSMEAKLAADPERMVKAEQEAKKAQKEKVYAGAAKNIAGEAMLNAGKIVLLGLLRNLLTEIKNGLVRFFREKAKSFKKFLSEMKNSIERFFAHLFDTVKESIKGGFSQFIGTVVSEIWKPIAKTFKFIKQGVFTAMKAIQYLADDKNKDVPFSTKMLKVGEIIVEGMVFGGALALGETFSVLILPLPGMSIPLPGIGPIANIIGFFLSSLICGTIGAVIINYIEKIFAEKQKSKITAKQQNKRNEVWAKKMTLIEIQRVKLNRQEERTYSRMRKRSEEFANYMRESCEQYVNGMNEINQILDKF